MQSRGIDFLLPIWQMLTANNYLGLLENEVGVSYEKYINEYKRPLLPNELSISDAVRDELTPGIKIVNFFSKVYVSGKCDI